MAADVFSQLTGVMPGDPAASEADAKALAARLRGQDNLLGYMSDLGIGAVSENAGKQRTSNRAEAEAIGLARTKALLDAQDQAQRELENQYNVRDYDEGVRQFGEEQKARMLAAQNAGATRGQLTAGQLQTGMEKWQKNANSLADIAGGVEAVDTMLAPYTKGGEREGEGIPGVGVLTGAREWYGDAARWVEDAVGKSNEAADMHTAISRVIGPLLVEGGGLAQTLTETANILRKYGITTLSDEDAFVNAYPEIRVALQNDLTRINATTAGQVKDEIRQGYPGGRLPTEITLPPLDLPARGERKPAAGYQSAPAPVPLVPQAGTKKVYDSATGTFKVVPK